MASKSAPSPLQQAVQFECQADCSNCCRIPEGYVFLKAEEAAFIAEYLQLQFEAFIRFFTRRIDDDLILVNGAEEACVFLEGQRCLIYPVRPQQCKTFPFWPQNMETPQHWEQTKALCPGIGQGRSFSPAEIASFLKDRAVE